MTAPALTPPRLPTLIHHHQTLTAAQVDLTAAQAQVKYSLVTISSKILLRGTQYDALHSSTFCHQLYMLETTKLRLFVMLQAAHHRLPLGQTQAPVVAQVQAAQMTAQAVAVTPAVAVKKMSQHLTLTALREQHQSITMALGIMLIHHIDLSKDQADGCNMPLEAVWSGTVIVITKMDTAGTMIMIGAVMTGSIQEAVAIGSTQGAVMGGKTTDQSLLLTPQPDALLARLVFLVITGPRLKRVSNRADSSKSLAEMGKSDQQMVLERGKAKAIVNSSAKCL